MTKVGEVAPQFALYNSDKEWVKLSDYQGRNKVILFFPFAFSGVCTKELCSVRDDITSYSGVDAEVLAISVDSVFCLARFKEEMGISFALLSDFNKEVSRMYDCLHETFALNMQGVSKRSAFVVDGNDKICYAEILENPAEVPDFEKIKEVLSSL